MNILLTSVGRRSYLIKYFQESLSSIGGKVHAANSIKTYALLQADEYTLTPNIYDDNYINFLINYCNKHQIKLIIPLFDIDLGVLSQYKKQFEQYGIKVLVSNPEVIKICNDKWLTYQFLLKNNIATPKTYLSLKEVTDNLKAGLIKLPLILKPRWGMGSISIYKVTSEEELLVLYRKVQAEIKNSYLKYESEQDVNKSVLIQEFICGDEFGIEVLNDLQSNYVSTFCKKKISMRAGETDIALTINNKELTQIGESLSQHLRHVALLDCDCLQKNGTFYVLEMNARFGGQYPFSHLSGINIPQQIINWHQGLNTDNSLLNIKYNVLAGKDINPVIIHE